MIAIIIALVGVLAYVLWPALRTFVNNNVRDIAKIIWDLIKKYYNTVKWVLPVILILIITGFFIPIGWYKGLAFLLAVGLFLAVWLPLGAALRLSKITEKVFPKGIMEFCSWLCFVGFLGVLFPDTLSNFNVILIAALVWGVFSGIATKYKTLETIVPWVVITLCIFAGIKYAAPDFWRAHTYWTQAAVDTEKTGLDRNRIGLQANSSSTYGRLLENIHVAYAAKTVGDSITLHDTTVYLAKDTVFLLVNHKMKVLLYQGQGFVEIRLAKANGSFINGPTVWIEANKMSIGTKAELVGQTAKNSPSASQAEPVTCTILQPGTYVYDLKAGEETSWLALPDCGKYSYKISSPQYDYKIFFSDKTDYNGGSKITIPEKEHVQFKVRSNGGEFITITIARG